jgi:hypothetical protein
LFINLTPFIPLSLKMKGEEKKEGLTPPLRRPVKLVSFKGGKRFREGLRPSFTYTPPSLIKGRGSGG